eukprot:TRINITY_DN832_c0_g1_i4.p1 TRINITY_DN832_c0_g1~~TRINITY_DN832_c0_g1_i4.p1  ORF type:complete len:128 (-),score=24.77 TRINITY_DN832_c0_g1_i4:385-768(-)
MSVGKGRKILTFGLKAFDTETLDYFAKRMIIAAKLLNMNVKGPAHMPMQVKKWTLNKSPHIDKKARDQFERRVFGQYISIDATPENASAYTNFVMKYIATLVPGVDIKVTTRQYLDLDKYYTGKKTI